MSLIQLTIDRIQYSETQTGAYVLVLKDINTEKKLPIVIGAFEAHSIAISLEEGLKQQRPISHDLFKTLFDEYQIQLKKIIINKFDQGIFYSMLITEKDGKEVAIDSRTSDAVALAVRFDAPIFCHDNIMEEAGMFLPTHENVSTEKEEEDFSELIGKMEETTEETAETGELNELEQLATELFGSKTSIYTKGEISKMLQAAIENEEYERAAKLKAYLEKM